MFGFGDAKDARDEVYNGRHQGHFSHELIAGGAAFEAMKVFEDRQRAKGEPVNHAFAKELLAGIAMAEVDKLAETKGEDAFDRYEAQKKAKQNVHHLYEQQYGNQDQYDPNQDRHPTMQY